MPSAPLRPKGARGTNGLRHLHSAWRPKSWECCHFCRPGLTFGNPKPCHGDQLWPDVLIGHLPVSLDGWTLVLVVQPSILLARAVAVMGKFALPAAVELLLPLEAGVAHDVNEAASEGEMKSRSTGAGGMAQKSRSNTALAEEPSVAPAFTRVAYYQL